MKEDSEYKESQIPWIGKIPTHWNIEPFGRHFSYGKGLPITKANLTNEGIAVISYGQIHSKLNTGTKISKELIRYVSPTYIESNPQSILKINDFIFADTSEDLNGSGNCAFNDFNNYIFAGYHTLIARPIRLDNPKYYAYLFQSQNWKNQIRSLVNGVKVYSINRAILKKTTLLFPPLSEQQHIVSFLDEKGAPSIVERAKILFPLSQIGAVTEGQRGQIINQSRLYGKYDKVIDRESAFEVLMEEAEAALKAEQETAAAESKKSSGGSGLLKGIFGAVVGAVVTSVTSSIGTEVSKKVTGKKSKTTAKDIAGKAVGSAARTATRQLTRSVLGTLLK